MKKIVLTTFTYLFFLNINASDTTFQITQKTIDGIYVYAGEYLHVSQKNKKFFLIRNQPKAQDVVIPICYDTIAKGHIKEVCSNVFSLFNDNNFSKVQFDIKQMNRFSEDTLYIMIELPQDDAFFPNRFRCLFSFSCIVSVVKADSLFIKVPRNVMTECESTFSLSLLMQDLYPQWCIEEEKCYQRIYFRIFDLVRINNRDNCLVISLKNFDECFVERIDVKNELIYFDGNNSILWRGKEYRRTDNISKQGGAN